MTSRTLRDRPRSPEEDRLFDLMRERAVYGLDDADSREFDRLTRTHDDVDVDCYDRTAAALDILFAERRAAPMPEHLKRRIAAGAPQAARSTPPVAKTGPAPRPTPTPAPIRASNRFAWTGWIAAAAASIVAILGWTREPAAPDAREVALELQREVDTAADRLVLPWKPTEDPAGRLVAGELHWSTALQKGYMSFRGLPANDPSRTQYQLWIFDAPRGTDHPVDGGVFDVAQGEVIVPIDAKIRVDDPSLFAVTAEQPGRVVVSKREHIVSLAQL